MNLNNVSSLKLGVIGCGKMAEAILSSVAKNKFLSSSNVYLYDINLKNSENLSLKYGFNILNSIEEIENNCDIILLAVKPFVVNDVLCELKVNYKNQLVLSILAGVKIEKYLSVISEIKIVRIMPNTPALVNCAMSAICPGNNISDNERDFAFNLMKNCGEVIITTEDQMDIITALSGSGPAFYYKIIDLMAKSACKLGLNYNQAILLSSQTALGSAKMVLKNDFNIEQLIKNVTTPGGCTEVGNNVLNSSNLEDILDTTIKDTMQKAHDLG